MFVALADSRWLIDYSEHIFRFAPMKMESAEVSGIHGPDERISISAFEEAVNFCYDFYAHLDDRGPVDMHSEL